MLEPWNGEFTAEVVDVCATVRPATSLRFVPVITTFVFVPAIAVVGVMAVIVGGSIIFAWEV